MGPQLKVLPGVLVDMGGPDDAKASNAGGQRDRARDACPRSLGRLDDLLGREVENPVIERLEYDPDFLSRDHRLALAL